MNKEQLLSINILVDYIKSHEQNTKLADEQTDYLTYLTNSQWQCELASMDHKLQSRLMGCSDDDLEKVIHSNEKYLPLSQMIDETTIILNMPAENRNKVLSELAKVACANRVAKSYEEIYLELESRERLSSTGIGYGVAIPHSRFPYQMVYKKPRLIIARTKSAIPFDAVDKKNVDLFFMPCAPTQYINMRMIAQIIKMLRSPEVVSSLRHTSNKKDILQAINSINF